MRTDREGRIGEMGAAMKANTAVQQNKHRTAAVFTVVVVLFLSIGLVIFNDRYLLQSIDSTEYPRFRMLFRVINLTGACTVVLIAFLGVLRHWSVTRLLPLAVSVLGAMFLFVIPPMAEPDGISHFGVIYHNAAILNGVKEPEGDFSWIVEMRPQDAASVREVRSLEDYEDWLSSFTSTEDRARQGTAPILGEKAEPHGYSVMVAIPHYSNGPYYWPATLAMAAGLAADLSFGWIGLLGCMVNLLIYILAVSYAVRKLPIGRRVFTVIVLLPISLQQAASLSYDSILLSASAVVVALGLRWSAEDHRFGRTRTDITEYIVFALGVYFLIITKNAIYAFLILLPFLMNLHKEAAGVKHLRKIHLCGHRIRQVFLALFLAVLFVLILRLAVVRVHGILYQHPFVADYGITRRIRPIDYLLDPAGTFLLVIKSTVSEGRDWIYQLFGGRLGTLGRIIDKRLIYPVILLFGISLIRREDEQQIGMAHRIAGVILALIPDILSIVAMLFFYTIDTDPIIRGVQGRYFLPTLCLLSISLFYWKKPVIKCRKDRGVWDQIMSACGLRTEYIDSMLIVLMTLLVWLISMDVLRV